MKNGQGRDRTGDAGVALTVKLVRSFLDRDFSFFGPVFYEISYLLMIEKWYSTRWNATLMVAARTRHRIFDMGTSIDETISTVLGWNQDERARLTYKLLLSLEDTSAEEAALSREDIDRLWMEEAQRRLADFDAGKTGCVPFDEAIRAAREDLVK